MLIEMLSHKKMVERTEMKSFTKGNTKSHFKNLNDLSWEMKAIRLGYFRKQKQEYRKNIASI